MSWALFLKTTHTHVFHLGGSNGELLWRDGSNLNRNATHAGQALGEEFRHDGIHQHLRPALPLNQDIADLFGGGGGRRDPVRQLGVFVWRLDGYAGCKTRNPLGWGGGGTRCRRGCIAGWMCLVDG